MTTTTNNNIKKSLQALNIKDLNFGVSTGQAAVFYNTEEYSHVLGGGWISEAPNMASLAQH